ncbi:hypothetical protein [Microbispora sp. ATCC PTA-5024]|uniref:hypothetical protein n=1 Tax=Microbispora sp. ATCC PTA-5024 TaxID=316330 RepID=UPI0003DDCFD3|nr:hypothetical protein [Microbispora sp. ATCC PTA-5024]ETK36182.1 hypothetical protein MPTA5024_11185 [Microbispora sp. ATCC PTA-5024]
MISSIAALPEPTTTKPAPRLSTDDALAFLDTVTPSEAHSMLMLLLGSDENGFIYAMESVQRRRARAGAVTR